MNLKYTGKDPTDITKHQKTYPTAMAQQTTSVTRNLTWTFTIVGTTKMTKTFANVTWYFLKKALIDAS